MVSDSTGDFPHFHAFAGITGVIPANHAVILGFVSANMKYHSVPSISVASMLFLQGCSEKQETKIIQQAESPDGSLVATVFIKEGGATLPLMVDVFLGAKGDQIPAFGNVFRENHSEKARVAWADMRE